MTDILLALDGTVPDAQARLLRRAVDVLKVVVNRPQFAAELCRHKLDRPFRSAGVTGKVPATCGEVHRIIAGAELLGTPPGAGSGTIRLRVRVSEIGTANAVMEPRYSRLAVDHRFLQTCVARDDPFRLAGVLLHEWMHLAGFDHPRPKSTFDVPSRVGTVTEHLGRALASAAGV